MRGQISGHRFSKFLGPANPNKTNAHSLDDAFADPLPGQSCETMGASEDYRVPSNDVSGRPFRNDRCGLDSVKLFRLNQSTLKFRNVRSGNPRDEWSR